MILGMENRTLARHVCQCLSVTYYDSVGKNFQIQ
jgi:hypothetical protein